MSVAYNVLTARKITRVVADDNGVPAITRAVKAAGIRPTTVRAITPVAVEDDTCRDCLWGFGPHAEHPRHH